ncbi:MAG: ferritin-like domain-containing protein [Actinomycetota bacterium]|nr:ferritin-like domain-containing protein [Actinomycetota bacterium]
MSLTDDALYYRLFDAAEQVRWRVQDVPWAAIQHEVIDDDLIGAVRRAVVGELQTFGGTRQLMDLFADDGDFTQWLAVWFYEETKHPHVLTLWLKHAGVVLTSDDMAAGHEAASFTNSRVVTLASNVVAEAIGAQSYLALARYSRDPVLAHIAYRLAGDEARHGSHFFSYLRREVARSSQPDRDRRRALIVLDMWLRNSEKVLHPAKTTLDFSGVSGNGVEWTMMRSALEDRLSRTFGFLVGEDLSTHDDVKRAIRKLPAQRGPTGPSR